MSVARARVLVGVVACLLGLVGLAQPPAARAAAAPFPSPLAARLQKDIDELRQTLPIPGLSASVILADGSRWNGSSGRAEVGPGGRSVRQDTSFVIGSITKTFVAALVVQLAAEGRLSLDDPVMKWLPSYANGKDITIRQLLNHTSGIFNYFEHKDYARLVFQRPTHRWTASEILRLDGASYFPPGTSYHYSNTNYVLLGLVAERVSRRSLGAEIRRRFLDPLRMKETFFQGEERVPLRPAQGYLYNYSLRRFSGLADATNTRPNTSAATVAWAAGAMVGSARDLATWVRALYDGTLIPAGWKTQMLDFGRYGYGLGVRRRSFGIEEAWGHTGSLRGFTAAGWYLPKLNLTVAVTTNRGRILPDLIAGRLAQTVFEYFDVRAPTVGMPAESLVPATAVRGQDVAVHVAWSASDDLSGLRRFDLERMTDGGPWVPFVGAPGAARATAQIFPPEHVYRIRIRGKDQAGNVGSWQEGVPFRVKRVDTGTGELPVVVIHRFAPPARLPLRD